MIFFPSLREIIDAEDDDDDDDDEMGEKEREDERVSVDAWQKKRFK